MNFGTPYARWEVTVSGRKFKIGQFVSYLGRQSASVKMSAHHAA
jgi:hypothetical protein